jgi:hypothetical protein
MAWRRQDQPRQTERVTPKMWSLNALSVELAVDRRSLARRLEGLEPATEKKIGARTERLYRLRDVFHYLGTGETQKLDLNSERAKLAVLQQERIRIEIAEKRGELLSRKGVVAHWRSMVSEWRSRLLALPNRAATMVARRDEAAAFAVLTDLVHEVLHGFSRSAVPPDVQERIGLYKRAREAEEMVE